MSAIEHEFFVSRDGVLSATREGDIPPYPRSRRELYGFAAGKTADSFIERAVHRTEMNLGTGHGFAGGDDSQGRMSQRPDAERKE